LKQDDTRIRPVPRAVEEEHHGFSVPEKDRYGVPRSLEERVFAVTRKRNKSVLGQLTQRKVTRVALAYIVVAWILMQFGEVTFDALRLPEWALTLLITLLLLGFPIALVFAWAYEVTPEGIRKDLEGDISSGSNVNGNDNLNSTKSTIAVLPFYDMTEHGDQGYFCEGLAEEILNSLCKVQGLGVASRVASFQFGGARGDVVEIGRKLKVKTILEGTVRKFGEKLRITVELVKTSDGYHLWSRQYDLTMHDLFDIQEDVANSVAKTLSLTLDQEDSDVGARCDPKAYELLLSGNSLLARHTMQDTLEARQLFIRSLEVDPDCGRAWEGLASTYGLEYMYFNATEENQKEALRTSAKAIELLPRRAGPHVLAGLANTMARNYGIAEDEFRQALELNPRSFEACYFFARMLVREGRLEEALEMFRRAAEIRPEDYESVLLQAQLEAGLGRADRASEVSRIGIERVTRALELNPDDNRARSLGAFALLRLGEKKKARDWMKTSIRNDPANPIVNYNAACFYALAGEREKAFDSLEKCLVKVGQISSEWLEHDSDLDSIREHPRFSEIIASITDKKMIKA
jgi:adenylate cyclase